MRHVTQHWLAEIGFALMVSPTEAVVSQSNRGSGQRCPAGLSVLTYFIEHVLGARLRRVQTFASHCYQLEFSRVILVSIKFFHPVLSVSSCRRVNRVDYHVALDLIFRADFL